MILDNKNTNLKVHEWIAKYTKEGIFSLVTGYFTIGAHAYLSDKINEKIMVRRFSSRLQKLDASFIFEPFVLFWFQKIG